jgi:hypothetical protein
MPRWIFVALAGSAWLGAGCGAGGSGGGTTDADTDTDTDTDSDTDTDTDSDTDTDTDADTDADLSCDGSWGTTWYVRPDGGDAVECTGLADAPYPGSGSGQPCAFSHPFIALPPEGAPLIAGGDRLIIAAGAYRMGLGAPGDGACDAGWSYACVMPPIPSGADAEHPTCIVGAGWNDGCAAPPELFGVERAAQVLDLTGSSHVRVECLELTDREGCVEFHSGDLPCERDDPPYGDWAGAGVRAADSAGVSLRNLDIHGLAHTGVHAGRLQDWTLEDVRISGNGWVGFDGDIAGDDGNSGTIAFRRVEISWNGCGETWPGGEPTGCWGQSAGGYGDGLGTGATGGDWVFEDCDVSHNTSDGIDLLYHSLGGAITVSRTRAEGNAGNQLKTRGRATVVNSVVVGNCGFFAGQPFTFDVDDCRAAGNALSLSFADADTIEIVNSTVHGEGDCLLLVGDDCAGSATLVSRNNVFLGATDFLQPFESTCFLYSECATLTFDQDFGVIHGTKHDGQCPWGPSDLCADPLLTGPLSGLAFGLAPAANSPAIDSGLAVGFLGLVPDVDFLDNPRPAGAGVDRGAYELQD